MSDNGQMKYALHICAACWRVDKKKLPHAECSKECPHSVSKWLEKIEAHSSHQNIFYPSYLQKHSSVEVHKAKDEIPNLPFSQAQLSFAGSDKICLEGASKPGEKSRTEFLLEAHTIIMQSKKYNFESCHTCDVWWLISWTPRGVKRKSRLKKVDEVFLFILVLNTLHFHLYSRKRRDVPTWRVAKRRYQGVENELLICIAV